MEVLFYYGNIYCKRNSGSCDCPCRSFNNQSKTLRPSPLLWRQLWFLRAQVRVQAVIIILFFSFNLSEFRKIKNMEKCDFKLKNIWNFVIMHVVTNLLNINFIESLIFFPKHENLCYNFITRTGGLKLILKSLDRKTLPVTECTSHRIASHRITY